MENIRILKEAILGAVKNAYQEGFGHEAPDQALALSWPPDISYGTFAVPCFNLAKVLRMKPDEIAAVLAAKLQPSDCVLTGTAEGPYLNVVVPNQTLFGTVCRESKELGDSFGNSQLGNGQRVMVEYLSPNTNKPLHFGHVRNGVLGMAMANILAATGSVVVRANLINDRGVHICKSMLAYQIWGNGQTPESTGEKGDHFVGRYYVLFEKEFEQEWRAHLQLHPDIANSPESDQAKARQEFFGQSKVGAAVQTLLQKWEAGDPAVLNLWQTMNYWVYQGFAQTYQVLGLAFDVFYYESETYLLGKDLVDKGLSTKVLSVLDAGQVVATVPAEVYGHNRKSGKKVEPPKQITLRREDGTSVYITQDLGTAVMKFEEHGLSRSIYVVGHEQDFHFQSLFAILGQLGYEWFRRCYHLSYGMVYLPEGKMKSREGTVVDADDLVAKMTHLAAAEIRERYPELPAADLWPRARSIGLAAIKFYLLRQAAHLDIHFDPAESIAFDGTTGPYCQYALARAKSIMRKAEERGLTQMARPDFSQLGTPEELQLAQLIMDFEITLTRSAQAYDPSLLANWLFRLAQAFNQFYHTSRVVDTAIDPHLVAARLSLVKATAIALQRGLTLLGIEPIDEM